MTAEPGATPTFSLLTPVSSGSALADTARSVLQQRLGRWEWLLVVSDRELEADLPPELGADRRVRVVPASSDVLAQARGEFLVPLAAGLVLEPRALRRMAAELADDVDLAYSDETLTSDDGTERVYRKPDWSPERLRHDDYLGHLTVLRRSVVEAVGGLGAGLGGPGHHDLVFRVGERARRVVHVPAVLVHGPVAEDPSGPAWDAGVRAVQDHLDRTGVPARAERGHSPGRYRVVREPDLTTSVSVVIPTIGSGGAVDGRHRDMVVEAVRSLRARSRHRDLEFVVVYDPPTPPGVLAELRALPGVRLTLVEFTEPFNFSAKCNLGASHATGDVLVFLNDDTEAMSDGLVEQLIAPLREDGVGLTGAKLLFPSMQVQHAGVLYGRGGITHRYYKRSHPGESGVRDDLWINREATALTGACLAVRRDVFAEVGGFREELPVNYNDVDLCLRIARTGRRLLWLHGTVLLHFESISRSPTVAQWEVDLMTSRWGEFASTRERYSSFLR